MKQRLLTVFLVLTVAVSGLLGSSASIAYGATIAETVIGDVNRDGKVTSTDYQIIKKIFAGGTFSDDLTENADVDYDGRISSTDYLIVKNIFLGVPVQVTPKALAPQSTSTDDGQAFDYKVSTTITDNMILQRNQYLNIFGTAEKTGGIIYVELMGETRYAVVDSNGEWCVQMSAHPASTVPVELNVYTKAQGPENGRIFRNILFGDVWLVAGQSNAQVTLEPTLIYNPFFVDEINPNDNIRLFNQWFWDCTNYWEEDFPTDFNRKYITKSPAIPQKDVPDGHIWQVNTVDNALGFSAIGYYFAKQIADHTDVPIGLIQMCAGGAALCDFMPPDQYDSRKHNIGESQFYHSDIYNSLMAPFSKTQVTGMLWYQGESDMCDYDQYADNLKDFVDMMRDIYGKKMEFYSVQLTSHNDVNHVWPELADMRFVQFDAIKLIDNYNLVCSMDYGWTVWDDDFAHPKYKKYIGDRLAYVALAKIYDYRHYSLNQYGSPYMYLATVKDGYAYFYFNNVGTGLMGVDNNPNILGFTNYETGAMLSATLESKNCVKVRVGRNKNMTVAYGNSSMANVATCNLCNSNGIGAVAFKYEVVQS